MAAVPARRASPGAIQYLDSNGQTNQVRLTDVGTPETFGDTWLPSTDGNRRLAAYAQDRWAVTDRLTVTAGVRYDRQTPYYEESQARAGAERCVRRVVTTGRDAARAQHRSRRASACRSIRPAAARRRFKAFYGRYYHNFASQFTGVNPGGTNTRTYGFNDLNGNRLYDGIQRTRRTWWRRAAARPRRSIPI